MSTLTAEDRLYRFGRIALPFHNGDEMDRRTYHELYKRAPENFRAELIDGVVYFKVSTHYLHARLHALVASWLTNYSVECDAVDVLDAPTTLLDIRNEPEPDLVMFIRREYGGRVRVDEDGFLTGVPELIVEIANTSKATDLGKKKLAYEAAGVKEYIVVLAKDNRVVWHQRRRGHFHELQSDDAIFCSVLFPGLWLNEKALFEKNIKVLTTTLRQGMQTAEFKSFAAAMEQKLIRKPLSERNGHS